MPPRVALVHHWLVGRRGGERVLARLAELLPDGTELFTLVHDHERAPAPPGIARVHTSALQRLPGWRRLFRAALPLHPALFARFDLSGFDLVLSSDASTAKCVRVPDGVPHVCYCYSPPRYAHDLRELYLARSVPAALRPLARRLLARTAAADRAAAQGVTELVAISEHVAARIRRAYDRDAVVIHPPVDTEFFTPGAPEPTDDERPYLLLGEAVPYKRFEVALDACRELDRALVVAGGGPGFEALRRRAGPRTEFVPAPDDGYVRALYRGCRALLFPGEEDFGLVPVEAMACGCPVIAWGVGGAAETVLHGETGWLYDVPRADSPRADAAADRADHVRCLRAAITAFEAWHPGYDPAAAVRRADAFSVRRFRAAMAGRLARHGAG